MVRERSTKGARLSLRSQTIVISVVLGALVLFLGPMQAVQASTYYDHPTVISMFKSLVNKYPDEASYVTIGRSAQGRSIWMFIVGNREGGGVLWDASLHGSEDIGAMVAYYFVEWLLTSGSPLANTILQKNALYIIPVANPDSYGRANANGVDLNHNFVYRWYDSPFTNRWDTYNYKGPSFVSEPETRALRYVFFTYRPKYYVNTHMWGGPWIGYVSRMPSSMYSPVIQRMRYYAARLGVPTFPVQYQSARGFAMGDAYSFGASAWLLEIIGAIGRPSLSQVKSVYYPKCKPVLLAMLSLAGGWL